MARDKRTGSEPVRLGRNERGDRRSNSQPKVVRTPSEWDNTGVFTGVSNPVKGVSDVVALSTRNMARRAKRMERRWNGAPTKSAIHDRIARMEARRASEAA